MDTLDFDAAKIQAENCVENISGFQFQLINRWVQYQENKATVDYFQGEAAKLFGKLATAYLCAHNAMNVDVLSALAKTHGKIDIPPAQVHGRKFDTWHEASIDILYGLLCIPVAVAENAELRTLVIAKKQVTPTPLGTIISLWRPENTRRLESVLLALEVDKNAYWKRVVDGVRNYPHENTDDIKVYLENEWACALKTDDNSPQKISESFIDGHAHGSFAPKVVLSAKLSPSELAKKYCVSPSALNKRLERWRYNHDTGYIEVQNPARNEPKYLYDESAVMPIIDDLKAKSVGQKRPSNVQQKKN